MLSSFAVFNNYIMSHRVPFRVEGNPGIINLHGLAMVFGSG